MASTDGGETIVWRTRERDQVGLCGWLCDGNFARVADGDFKKSSSVCHGIDRVSLKGSTFGVEVEAVDEAW